jgi:ankyrin repeat protein
LFRRHLAAYALLVLCPSSVGGGQKPDNRPFLVAARDGDLAKVRVRLDAGQDVNVLDGDGSTALMLAVVQQHDEVALLLLERGADPNIADKRGQVPLMYAGNVYGVERIGILNVNTVKSRDTAVTAALVDHGANVNAAARDGRTPLFFAIETANKASLKLFIAKGANVNAISKEQVSPLILAAQRLDAATATELCAAGADKSPKDRKGRDAQTVAESYKGSKDYMAKYGDQARRDFRATLEKCR